MTTTADRTAANEAREVSGAPRTPDTAARVAAIVLAAGRSSRMGASKALLPIGRVTALERVVASLRQAGAGQIVVVTGHDPVALAPVLDRLGVESVHNAGYQAGMFSSLQTGVAALRPDVEAFFVHPVDCPLVTVGSMRLLLDAFDVNALALGNETIVYPACCGRRGHPPLLSARYVRPLVEADKSRNLRDFLAEFAEHEIEVDVRDLTVLMDMDTPREHRILERFAAALDGASAGGGQEPSPNREPPLTSEEALFILETAGTPPNVVAHCRATAVAGVALAEALQPLLPHLDVGLTRAGCLLHDFARLMPHHAQLAEEVLARLGYPRVAAVVGQHMVICPELPRAPGVTEAELVYLADKLVADDELAGLDERQARAFRKLRPGPEGARRIRERIGDARRIARKVEEVTGRSLDDILAPVANAAPAASIAPAANATPATRAAVPVASAAPAPRLRVYLARHAQPEGPGGRRFLGQTDPPLGAAGEEQAGRLAGILMEMAGGACFDRIYCSDLSRSLRTAEMVAAECATLVHAEPALREIDVGLWEGMTWEEARAAYPEEHRERERNVTSLPFPQGESFMGLQARVLPRFLQIIDDGLAAGHRRLLVVGHKGVNRVILAHFLGLPLAEIFSIEQDYCAVTVLEFAGPTGKLTQPPRLSPIYPR